MSQLLGYDVVGDVHGCATLLTRLLERLGYRMNPHSGAYQHPERRAVFVGDLVDRGDEQLRTLQTVRQMVDSGSALMVMGNHEFNAIAYATEHPDRPGEYLRPHTEKNTKQHKAFLSQLDADTRAEYLQWFMTIPLWRDLGGLRVVHACWHEPSMHVVKEVLGSDRFSSREQFVNASAKGDPLYEAIEVLLKGPEINLTRYGQPPYHDKDGHARNSARVAWWRTGATTLRELAVLDSTFQTAAGAPYPLLPDTQVDLADRSFTYLGAVPVYYGHYWRSGQPQLGSDYTTNTACVDFSAVKTGNLVAYQWNGETEIDPSHYVG